MLEYHKFHAKYRTTLRTQLYMHAVWVSACASTRHPMPIILSHPAAAPQAQGRTWMASQGTQRLSRGRLGGPAVPNHESGGDRDFALSELESFETRLGLLQSTRPATAEERFASPGGYFARPFGHIPDGLEPVHIRRVSGARARDQAWPSSRRRAAPRTPAHHSRKHHPTRRAEGLGLQTVRPLRASRTRGQRTLPRRASSRGCCSRLELARRRRAARRCA